MRKYRTFSEVTTEYYRNHPEEIDEFLKVAFEEYSLDNDTKALLSALKIVCDARDIFVLAKLKNITLSSWQDTYSKDSSHKLEDISAIMKALGYRLAPERIQSRAS
ncbi:MAG: addiction module antidote protein [Cyanobacteria bacterium P01_F01_bin.33]